MSDRSKRKSANQPPVSAHPAFPVIVALWFAALFGIGSMVLPLDLFERFAVSSSLADAYAAAQPPLGATARIVVAVVASLIGAAAGLFVARRVAAASAPRPVNRRAAALQPAPSPAMPAKRPISAHEELFEGGLDAEEEAPARSPSAVRRRSLTVTDESAPSDFLAFAPLPGRSANDADEPLDLLGFDEPDEFAEEPAVDAAEQLAEEPSMIEAAPQAFGTSALSPPPSATFGAAPFAPPTTQVRFSTAPFARSEPGQPVRPQEFERAEPAAPVAPLADRPLAHLSVVELVERFALALESHRTRTEALTTVPAAEEVAPAEPFAADTAPAALPDTVVEQEFAAAEPVAADEPAPLPAALRPFGFDESDDDVDEEEAESLPDLDLTHALSHARAPFALPLGQELVADEADEASEDETAEESYSSLLAMKSPLVTREAVRIDDEDESAEEAFEPVVVFPGQAARHAAVAAAPARPFDAPAERAERPAAAAPRAAQSDPGATERALREALEKLQRMSGAA